MNHRIKRAGRTAGLHFRRQAIGYVALAVALTGSAYAGSKSGSSKVGARDLRPVIVREGQSVSAQPGLSTGGIEATCEPGERAVAPSVVGAVAGDGRRIALSSIGVTGDPVKEGSARIRPTGFVYSGHNASSEPLSFTAEVACLRP
jgi:hypothetical protein